MKVLLFGATGMVGAGALRECLEDRRVDSVVSVVRRASGRTHAKLREVVLQDLFDLESVADQLGPRDAAFYCVGVSAAGLGEAAYRKTTLDLTLAVADALEAINPRMTFCFVSGQGADSSGRGRVMWARIKGQAENALLERSFTTYVFRPGVIQPMKGVRSRTPAYRVLYTVMNPVMPLLRRAFPRSVTTTVRVGRAMIAAAIQGARKSVLETADINELGREA